MSSKNRKPAVSSTPKNSFVGKWRSQSWAVRTLRVWLGVTFTYAGLYKALDGGFLDSHATTYIGRQLAGFARTSPISSIMQKMIEHATLVGFGTIIVELAIGLATLLGFVEFYAAIAGAGLSFMLWLTASWGTTPYFLASDSAYVVLWLVLAFMIAPNKQRVKNELALDRRAVVRVGFLGALSLAFFGVGKLFASAPIDAKKAATTAASAPTGALVALKDLPVNSSADITLASGDPGVVVRLAEDKVCAFSAVCTHNGCTVAYDSAQKVFLCPCHGAAFDPANHAQVLQGPANRPLDEVAVKIEKGYVVTA
ncbi:unannotated protein [freshwater metagenome]|uniref:Unannotated protein n=1 Tax=freshwater metagenome TaxID=449393 RepID=A0A6J6MB45_9ZZZZ|nr:Rieske 2Fe-2S domain-containing protein [Actinomycetota bacterium]MSY51151.1 Rieske 2Fe-2S domain-containing protein [Actinomycetota bacterium]MSY87079.1 Rieske 2Fe-2S domain-containing protein [Actinomycetota bacterium]